MTIEQAIRILDPATTAEELAAIDYYGGLHCGECMEVFAGGKWKPTRIEYGENWYLVGVRAEDLNGLRVRI